ncbi:hypothetical protein CTDIVETGP_1310 [Clostridium tyrobutyricum DIVETGP]|uniref:Uncharacterized protein n=3 Tax=Clostridium tyrobutyricum TaxID=1519 RepID=W6N5D3_CLOTY|nr:hypothetical protein CTK_P00160 [Clostridium tyrobutyricum]ANP70942.1 hypothetical protein BA182_14695 [Clostridium tyrobutyricum]QCH29386.1 hypothetical protein EZN00_03019 [Clostridium tyrobutyricum]CDL91240.1 hypothetical protein CTDIVETGP_1310 [Clostridium tyrobutyricum DIVETGP]
MNMSLKLLKPLKILLMSQLLSIIFVIIARININLLLSRTNLLTNSTVLILSIIAFTVFCTTISILFLNEKFINVILISISYILYWHIVSSKIFFLHNNSNDYGFGFLGISVELFVGLFQYILVIICSIVAVSIHKTKNAIKNND